MTQKLRTLELEGFYVNNKVKNMNFNNEILTML